MQINSLSGKGVAILVVDDDALITLNTADQLSELGYEPLEAFSAAEALSILERRSDVAALITDFSMPVMNGVELAKAARAMRGDLPILLATGYAEVPGEAPADLVLLEKPFRQDDLAQKLNALLGLVPAK